MSAPLFSSRSVFWRVNREMACGLAAPRAVLMQIAHPLVAAGVAEHSEFRTHRFARLYRTAVAAAAITFGTREFASRALETINKKHLLVHGTLQAQTGIFPAGTRYNANDPALKLWVLSTITDSAITAYDTLVARLSLEDRRSYYKDSLLAADIFGIPARFMPRTYEEFLAYMEAMLSSGVICVGADAQAIARALFDPTPSGLLLLAGSATGLTMLPKQLRHEFGFDWRFRRHLLPVPPLVRAIRRVTPTVLWANPAATLSQLTGWWRGWNTGDLTPGKIRYDERP